MTKISQIVDEATTIEDNDWYEMELADGSSVKIKGSNLKLAVSQSVFDYIILRSTGPDAHRWKFTVGDDGVLTQPGEDLGV